MNDFRFNHPTIHYVTDITAKFKLMESGAAYLDIIVHDANNNAETVTFWTGQNDYAAIERLEAVGAAISAAGNAPRQLSLVDLVNGTADERRHEEPVS